MLKMLLSSPEIQSALVDLISALGLALAGLLGHLLFRLLRTVGVRLNEAQTRQALEISKTVAAYAEEWARSALPGGKPAGPEKLVVAIALAKDMATGALKTWSEEKWAAHIQAQLPEQRVKLSMPAPPSLPPPSELAKRYLLP